MTATRRLAGGAERLLSSALLHPSRFSSSRIARDGQGTDRVLLIGDRHALASRKDPEVRFAEYLADAVVARTGRGLELDTVWDLVPVLRAIGDATRARGRGQYDAVVVLIHNAPSRGRSTGSRTLQRLLTRLLSRLGLATAVELVFLDHPSRNETSRAARRFSEQILTGLDDPDERVESVTVPSGLLDVSSDAAAVAKTLAPRLAPPIGQDVDPISRPWSRPEFIPDVGQAGTPGLQRVVTLAVRSFDVPFAAVSLFDGPVVWTVACTSTPGPPIDGLLHAFENEGTRMVLVPDIGDDPVLRTVRTGDDDGVVRFWAACPIESVAGTLLGAVSVFDTVPHEFYTGDELMLHDLAQLAGAEIDSYRPGH